MRPEVNSNRFKISNHFEKSFLLHGNFNAANLEISHLFHIVCIGISTPPYFSPSPPFLGQFPLCPIPPFKAIRPNFPGDIEILSCYPAGPVLPHGDKVPLQPWLATILVMVSRYKCLMGQMFYIDIVSSRVGTPPSLREPRFLGTPPLSEENLKSNPLFLRAIQIGECKL